MRTGIERDRDARFAHKLVGRMRLWSASGDHMTPLVRRSENARQPPQYKGRGAGTADDAAGTDDNWPLAAVTVHGRTRQQRYSNSADWAYIQSCVEAAHGPTVSAPPALAADEYDLSSPRLRRAWGIAPDLDIGAALAESAASVAPLQLRPPVLPVIGNGDVMSWHEWQEHIDVGGVDTCLLARGALIKPWLCTEIKERRDWDISSSERLQILRDFTNFGLEQRVQKG